MTRYLISFPSGAMDHIPAEEFPAVGEAAHAVVQEAMDAGVWVFGGGLAEDVDPVMVAGDGTITAGTYPRPKSSTEGSRSSTCPLGRQRWVVEHDEDDALRAGRRLRRLERRPVRHRIADVDVDRPSKRLTHRARPPVLLWLTVACQGPAPSAAARTAVAQQTPGTERIVRNG